MSSDARGRTRGQDVFVHARHPDGTTDIVGRHRLVRPPAGRHYGELEHVGSWLDNTQGRAFALNPG